MREELEIGKERLRSAMQRGDAREIAEAARSLGREGLRDPSWSEHPDLPAGAALAGMGNARGLRALLEAGLDPSQRDSFGRTAGHWAALAGSEACLRELLSRGMDPSAADREGRTAGHEAARGGRGGCLEALLEAGLDEGVRSAKGMTAEEEAGAAARARLAAPGALGCEETLRARRLAREEAEGIGGGLARGLESAAAGKRRL